MTDVLRVIEEFNSKHNIKDVIENITGVQIKRKSLCCPLHGGDNKNGSSINPAKNIFTCWTSSCGRGITPWGFISKYYNLNGFKEVAEKANFLFNANIPIYEKKSIQALEKNIEGDKILKVENYLSECKSSLIAEIEECNHILLNANTGLGKTYGLIDLLKDNKNMDYIFFLVPTRSIAEQITKDYPSFNIFYGNDIVLPRSRYIVSTYHKIHMLEKAIEGEIEARAILGDFPPMYTVVVDEAHELQSKRKLLGNKARMIENFIKNSDKSILMSANTSYINKTYKDKSLFNRYITVDTENIKYNADNLNILRLPKGNDQKRALTINLIKDKLQDYNNVIFYEDSVEQLKTYETELKDLGFECISINSQNKNEEEIAEEYKNIIENSKLSKTIILTTSLINAGVNIKSNKVALIVKQDRNKFDIQKIEQFLARVRTNDNDLTLLLGSTDKEVNKNIIPYEMFIGKLERESESARIFFNNYIFNEFGLGSTHEVVKNRWNNYKLNEAYAIVKDIMFVENGLLKIDFPMLMEQARLEFERANYYNDKFILEQLENVKAKNKKIIYLAPVTVEKKITLKEENTLKDDTLLVMQDNNSIKEFLKLVKKEIKGTQLQVELFREYYNKYKNNTLFKEMLKILRSLIIPNKANENISKVTLFTSILLAYTEDTSKKEREMTINNIKRVEIYNKENPLGATQESIRAIGDFTYFVVRKNFDCYALKSNHPIKNSAYNWAFNDLMELRKLEPLNDKYFIDDNKKKYKIKDIVNEIENCTNSIYEITEKNYIIALK